MFRTHLFTTFWYFDSEDFENISSVNPLLTFFCLYMYSHKLKFSISTHVQIILRIIIDAFKKLFPIFVTLSFILVVIHLGSTIHRLNSVYFEIKLVPDANKILKQIFTKNVKVRKNLNNNNFLLGTGSPDHKVPWHADFRLQRPCLKLNSHMTGTSNAKSSLRSKKRNNLKSECVHCRWCNTTQSNEDTDNTNYG